MRCSWWLTGSLVNHHSLTMSAKTAARARLRQGARRFLTSIELTYCGGVFFSNGYLGTTILPEAAARQEQRLLCTLWDAQAVRKRCDERTRFVRIEASWSEKANPMWGDWDGCGPSTSELAGWGWVHWQSDSNVAYIQQIWMGHPNPLQGDVGVRDVRGVRGVLCFLVVRGPLWHLGPLCQWQICQLWRPQPSWR